MNIAIVKYNAGNIHSVINALGRLGVKALLTDNEEELRRADKVIFPGVGEASTTMEYLRAHNLNRLKGGVVYYMLAFGSVQIHQMKPADTCILKAQRHEDKVPHMGWNTIETDGKGIFKGFDKPEYVYFVHSFYVPVCDWTAARTDYILPFSASLHKDNFYATQFHPEKSGGTGELILKNFLDI